jgi:hypothetical protein
VIDPVGKEIVAVESSSLNVQSHEPSAAPLTYDQMFDMGDVDAQSDDMESNQDGSIVGVGQAFDNDFNDIYYQCRYERYAAFSRANLLNEVLSLCANIDRLQHEKSEVEKRLRDVQQHLYDLTSTPSSTTTATNLPNGVSQERSTNDEGTEDDSRVRSDWLGRDSMACVCTLIDEISVAECRRK